MSRPFGISDFGGAEDRLRNALDLEGKVGVDVADKSIIQPVLIVGDATRPGMCSSRDRRFLFGNGWVAVASGAIIAIKPLADIVIERIVISMSGAGSGALIQHCFQPPGAADLVTYSVPNNPLVDFGRGERAPISTGTVNSALPVVQGSTEIPAASSQPLELGFSLQRGAQFAWRVVVNTTGTAALWGIARTI